MIKRVLVIGGCGFIGSEIVSQLIKNSYEVIVYDIREWDNRVNNIKYIKDNVEYIKGDIIGSVHLNETISYSDAIIHMVGLADSRIAQEHPELSFDLNLRSLQIVLEAAKKANIKRFIVPSSASIYGPVDSSSIAEETQTKLTSIYSYHKFMTEKLAECYASNYNMSITILRLFNVFGVRGSGILNILIDNGLSGKVTKLYGEKQKRDFIHVSDIAKAFISILKLNHNGYQLYNVGTGVGRSIEDIVNLVREYLPGILVEYGNSRAIPYDSVADISKIRKETSFDPEKSDIKLRETIQQIINDFRK